jgi:hypothetical protein
MERQHYYLYKCDSESGLIRSETSMQVTCNPEDLCIVMGRYMHYRGGGHFQARDVDDNIVAKASFVLSE